LSTWRHEAGRVTWIDAIATGQASPLLYALAEYHDDRDRADRVRDRLFGASRAPN
jgi:hypothetical protein